MWCIFDKNFLIFTLQLVYLRKILAEGTKDPEFLQKLEEGNVSSSSMFVSPDINQKLC